MRINFQRINNVEIQKNNLMAAIIICYGLINAVVGYLNISIFLLFILFLTELINHDIRFNMKSFFIIVYLCVMFLFSFWSVEDATYTMHYFIRFLTFGIISFIGGMQDINIEKVFFYVENIGFVAVLICVVRGFEDFDQSLRMGFSYSLLPVFLISFVFLVSSKRRIISIINVVLSLHFYISLAPRGLWLTMGIFLILYLFYILSKNAKGIRQLIVQLLVLLSVIAIGITVYKNLALILTLVNSVFFRFTGVKIYAIEKFTYLFAHDRIGNGREELMDMAKILIQNNLLFGRGIGYFEMVSGGQYVHNILFQSLCEAGLFFAIPLLFMMLNGVVILFANKQNQQRYPYIFFLILFVDGLVMLFYSSVYWQNILFWYLLGYEIKYNRLGRGRR